MGTISSGVGLISGLDIQSLISQLMTIEQRPRDLLSDRIELLTTQQTALMSLQARVMALQLTAANFNKESIFQQKAVSSTNEDVLTVSADRFAAEGSYKFIVKRLASSHQLVSRGYSSLDSSLGTGAVSFEIGNGQLARPTELSFINGQNGFQRGAITITDRAGNTSDIDLAAALTVQDILDEINNDTTVNVTATVSGDSIIVMDNTQGTGTFSITGDAAESLGIAQTASAGDPNRIAGTDILYLTADTHLDALNDGNGVRGLDFGDDLIFQRDGLDLFAVDLRDKLFEVISAPEQSNTLQSLNRGNGVRLGTFRITDQNGRSVDIDLNELDALYGSRTTVAHLRDFIDQKVQEKNDQLLAADPNATLMDLTVSFTGSDNLTITDNSEPFDTAEDAERISNFIIEDLDGGFAANDLGIVEDVSGSTIYGETVWYMESVGDAINAVNNYWANWDDALAGEDKRILTAALDASGNGLTLTHNGAGIITVNDTDAAVDLGIANTHGFDTFNYGQRLIAGLNTVMLRSLKGGSAGSDRIEIGGDVNLTDRAGNSVNLDLIQAFTVQDVLDAINQAGANITASVNAAGNGILLTDTTAEADVVGNLEVTGDLAEKLNITAAAADNLTSVNSDNLQLQYISEASMLDDLRAGQGIRLGQIRVTDGDGATQTIDLAQNNINTLQDVIDAFASSGTNLRARINDTGDGLLIYDEISTGGATITIEEVDGNTAHDLGILGTAENGETFIDGSYEYKFEMGGGDTLQDLITRINDTDIGVQASLVNDGSGNNPYRISFISEITGRAGAVYLDAGTTNLTTQTLCEAQDALVLFGDDPNNTFLITSSSNTIEDAIQGATLELHGVSDTAVEVSVTQDLEGIITQMNSFVDAFNAVMDDIAELDSFNPDTLERGILFADRSVHSVQNALNSMVSRIVPGTPTTLNRLASVGIKFSPLGFESGTNDAGEQRNYAVVTTPQLAFNEDTFLEAFAANPEGVAQLFTKEDTGIGDYLAEQLEQLAGSTESTLKSRVDAMTDQRDMFEDRISYLDDMLDRKEKRLYSQFYAMEQALASLQTQQSALSNLSASLLTQ